MSAETISDALERALDAYTVLAELGEGIEDEWSYVNDLSSAWIERLDAVADARGAEPAPDGGAIALPALIEEAAALDDPHRAIDWLSTFPQVLLVALGERP